MDLLFHLFYSLLLMVFFLVLHIYFNFFAKITYLWHIFSKRFYFRLIFYQQRIASPDQIRSILSFNRQLRVHHAPHAHSDHSYS